ncbi:nucleotide sugar dehydrogenase [Ferrimicrobium sp.]|uniref:nucleotide sugar dehydrogenase n=1 Tax=Ferrimicrobium sp. TaxID=2926050 RepID=UPI00262FA28A|nr:nucleotide sugar dehydrogenase [Ferrimicrobium sp.]
MRLAIIGLWHLGCVFSGSLAALGHSVVAIDEDDDVIRRLRAGKLPVEEPGLAALLSEGVNSGSLRFSNTLGEVSSAELVWLTIDTPVRSDDTADLAPVLDTAHRVASLMDSNSVLVISSQIPLGTSRQILRDARSARPDGCFEVAYCPENLRLGSAISSFREADRFVIGASSSRAASVVEESLSPVGAPVLSMSLESAELSKHALNAFLAMSVAFANEVGRLAEIGGADAREVAKSLKLESRIGPRSYVMPGGPIAGGTLARDVRYLTGLGETFGTAIPLISSILVSNSIQQSWAVDSLAEYCSPDSGPVLVFGLAYKQGTSTLRHSFGIDVARNLVARGYNTRTYDSLAEPTSLPEENNGIERIDELEVALEGVAAVIVCAEDSSSDRLLELIRAKESAPILIDAAGIIAKRPVPERVVIKVPGRGVEPR